MVLVALAFVLDETSGVVRDYALVVGAPALYVLLPATLLWLAIAVCGTRSGRGGGEAADLGGRTSTRTALSVNRFARECRSLETVGRVGVRLRRRMPAGPRFRPGS